MQVGANLDRFWSSLTISPPKGKLSKQASVCSWDMPLIIKYSKFCPHLLSEIVLLFRMLLLWETHRAGESETWRAFIRKLSPKQAHKKAILEQHNILQPVPFNSNKERPKLQLPSQHPPPQHNVALAISCKVFWDDQQLQVPYAFLEWALDLQFQLLRRRRDNQHKQLFGTVPGTGGGQNCLCCLFSWGEIKHKQNSQDISGKGSDSPATILG